MKLYTHTNRKSVKVLPLERGWTRWRIYNFISFCVVEMLDKGMD